MYCKEIIISFTILGFFNLLNKNSVFFNILLLLTIKAPPIPPIIGLPHSNEKKEASPKDPGPFLKVLFGLI